MVKFQLEDVISPELIFVLKNITRQLEMTGKVLFLSDSGQKKKHFAVVEVDGVMAPVVVPVQQLRIRHG